MSREDGKLSEMGCQLTFLASKQANPRSPGMEAFWEHAGLVWPWTGEGWYLVVFRGGGCVCVCWGGGSDILYAHMPSMQSVT